ncbi:MAG: VCBS repeat-containing protein [Acidobacteria bacterium]|nr:VCBS repeat-containing protein [Acidobacteriota bacterium]
MDLWVESNGGANIGSHFMINSGDGTRFDLDIERAPFELLHNPPPEFWRHYLGHLIDVDNDGDLDLALGQLRDDHFTHVNQFSIVLINDGTGHIPTRVELQHPRFYRGYTAVQGIADLDFNRDGWRDLALLHTRNDDLSTDEETGVLTFTGRYVQALVNRGDLTFSDETRTRIVQGPTRAQRFPNGEALYNAGGLVMRDLNRDGCLDLVLAATWGPIRRQSPIAYRNNGRGQFRPLPHKQFQRYPGDLNPGYGTWPADVNGDGLRRRLGWKSATSALHQAAA